MFVVILYFLMSFALSMCMNNDSRIITSDNQEFTLAQWQIEASRLMHRKQELQKAKEAYYGVSSAPITLKTICSEKINLFRDALTHKEFGPYFEKLDDNKKRMLKCAAGETELDSPFITTELLKCCFDHDFLQENIMPHLPMSDIVDCLQYLLIMNNCKNKKFETIKNSDDMIVHAGQDGHYNRIPSSLLDFKYMGSFPERKFECIAEKWWMLDSLLIINEDECYRVTPLNPGDKFAEENNKKRLWFTNKDCSQAVVKKIITHSHSINHILFSDNGKYLATASLAPQAGLVLTDLSLAFLPDRFLTGHSGDIHAISFNNQSTLLAVGSDNGIQFWDVEKNQLAVIFDDCVDKPVGRCTFGGNAFFAACMLPTRNNVSCINLWNVADLSSIRLIKSIIFTDCIPKSFYFDFTCGKLIATTRHNVVLIDINSGEIVMKTDHVAAIDWQMHTAIVMPNIDILAVASIAGTPDCCVSLWDIKSGTLLATLLKNQKIIRSIGASARRIFSVFNDDQVVETSLYDKSFGESLDWIDEDTTLLQRYLLYRLHRVHQNNEEAIIDPDCPEYNILENLLTIPNVKALIGYLLKK